MIETDKEEKLVRSWAKIMSAMPWGSLIPWEQVAVDAFRRRAKLEKERKDNDRDS